MGQYKFYINLKTMLAIGLEYAAGFRFEAPILCFTFGIGLTDSAKGFGFWRC